MSVENRTDTRPGMITSVARNVRSAWTDLVHPELRRAKGYLSSIDQALSAPEDPGLERTILYVQVRGGYDNKVMSIPLRRDLSKVGALSEVRQLRAIFSEALHYQEGEAVTQTEAELRARFSNTLR